MEQAGVQLVAAGANAYIGDLKSATSATNTFVDSTEKGGGRVSAAGQVMIGALRKVGSVAVEAFADAARATVAFIGDSISLAGDFEQGMLNFQAVAGQDVDTQGLEDFRDLFLDIGKRLPVSTMEVQQAAAEMVKGGIDPAIIAAGGLEQNIQFAAAAMEGDLVGAAEISSKILGGWADANATAAQKADFLTHSTNLLTKAANASAVDVEGLSLGIFNAQGIAKTAGVSFDDLTTTLAALAPRFASSSEAGNSLKNMIARLQPTTDPAASAMAALGLYTEETGSAFYDAQGNFIGFEASAQLLQESLKGLTKEQQASLLQTIFGNDAMGSAAALADMGAAGYQHMAEAMATANGVAENAALKQAGFNTSLDNAKGSVEAMQIQLGSHLLPILGDLLDNYITPGINAVSDVADAFFEAGGMSSEFGESIGALASTLGLPGEQIQDIVFAAQDLVTWFTSADGAAQDLASAHDVLGDVLTDLSGIWDHLMVVVGDVMDGYMAIAQAVLPIVDQLWKEHGAEITAFVKDTYESVIEIVNLALDLYDAIVPPVLNGIAGFFEAHGSEIAKILTGAGQAIGAIVTGTMETIKGVFRLALDLIHGDWDAVWNDLLGIGKAQADAIGGVVTGFLDMVAGIFDTSLDDILQTWSDNWSMAFDIVTSIDWAEAGNAAVQGIQQGISDAWGAFIDWLVDKAGDALDAVFETWGVSSPAKEWVPAGMWAVQGIMQGFSDNWGNLTNLIGSLSGDLIDEMQDIGSQINSIIADSFNATASIDRQIAKNLDSFKDVLPEYQQYTAGALKQVQSEAEAFLDPAEGAKYFQMRSKQILEYAKLQKDLSEAESAEDRARIEQQMLLINRAQQAEISAFQTNAQTTSPMATLANQVNAVMEALSHINLTDDQIKIVDMLAGVWGALQTPIATRQQAYANPPQMQYPSGGQTTNSSTTNVNMPIYTNNTPGALQQSWQILQASMP